MAVYLICAGSSVPTAGSRVKIGYSEDISERVATLQTAHWDRLHVIREWVGTRAHETWLHRRFREHRIARDWFMFHEDMMSISVPPDVRAQKRHHVPRKVSGCAGDILVKLGGKTKIAQALGLDTDAVCKWHVRGIPYKYQWRILALPAAASAGITQEMLLGARPALASGEIARAP